MLDTLGATPNLHPYDQTAALSCPLDGNTAIPILDSYDLTHKAACYGTLKATPIHPFCTPTTLRQLIHAFRGLHPYDQTAAPFCPSEGYTSTPILHPYDLTHKAACLTL